MNRSGNSAMHVPLHRYCYYASARITVKIIIADDILDPFEPTHRDIILASRRKSYEPLARCPLDNTSVEYITSSDDDLTIV